MRMGKITALASDVYREYNIPGVPSSLFKEPAKHEIRDLFAQLDGELDRLGNSLFTYGLVADGTSHPLSTVTRFKNQICTGWTLAQWQAAVPQVTSLANEIDRIAIQAFWNDRPNGGRMFLPEGGVMLDAPIRTGLNQHIIIEGAGREVTQIYTLHTGVIWEHGGSGSATAASGVFFARGFRIIPRAAGGTMFWIRFSGAQPHYCLKLEDILQLATDSTNYIGKFCRIWNYNRGAMFRDLAVFGRNFAILGTDAFTFEPNAGADCPPGALNTGSGDTADFHNVMTVGYNYAVCYDYTGFTGSTHLHEEMQAWNLQAYSGVGLLKAVNNNDSYAPSDNFTLVGCGWQGQGPMIEARWVEHLRMRDTLIVNDPSTNAWSGMVLTDCRDVTFETNEFFLFTSSSFGVCGVYGSRTHNVRFVNNTVLNDATNFYEWLYIDSTVPARQVIERGSVFRGTATYTNGKVYDASGGAISETRVKDIVEALPGTAWSWDVRPDGSTVYSNVHTGTTNASGNITVTLPTNLFRSVRTVIGTNGFSGINSPFGVGSTSTTSIEFRYVALTSATSVGFYYEVVGR